MPDQQTAQLTDARFLAVLRYVADSAVDATGAGVRRRIGEVMAQIHRRPTDLPGDADAEPKGTYDDWLDGVLGQSLRNPSDQLRAMLEARARLGQNIRLIEDIKLDRIREALLDPDEAPISFDDINTLLDFVDEVRKIAKEI